MLFLNFTGEVVDAFRSKYREVAEKYKSEGISFLLGDVEASQGAFQVGVFSSASFYLFMSSFLENNTISIDIS